MKFEYLKAHFNSELASQIEQIKETYDKWGNLIYTIAELQNTNKKELIKQLRANLEIEYAKRIRR